MRVLVTGARGFVGRNLCAQLRNMRDGRAAGSPVGIGEVFEYDLDSSPEDLERYCREADFVFNLAGVNRPSDPSEFMAGNFGFASTLLDCLARHGNRCPVMLSSSVQATLAGRYAHGDYGRSKLAGEELFFRYGEETGARVLVYRFPNIFGKWCRPDYNSAVATFCHNIARGLPVRVSDPSVELTLVYIDDLVEEMVRALAGLEHRCRFEGAEAVADPAGRYCTVPVVHRATLGGIVGLLETFAGYPRTLGVPDLSPGSFEKKLYSTFLSSLPPEGMCHGLTTHSDSRGSFTEVVRTACAGQFSVNVSRPGVTKGGHWHHTKAERFVVVSGRGLVRLRMEGCPEVLEFEVDGASPSVVEIPPGYTHSITNLSSAEDLVTLMWCNEAFDPGRPDTYPDPV